VPAKEGMQDAEVIQLYPPASSPVALKGLYLRHRLHEIGRQGSPIIYSNFIATLDGRIALASPGRLTHQVPAVATNERDWRLYQELAAQSDLLITSARFFRQTELGEAQDALPLSSKAGFADLHAWRTRVGLAPQPDVAIMSASLDIPLPVLEHHSDRKIFVLTGERADPEKVEILTRAGVEVVFAGRGATVNGHALLEEMGSRG
jgi:riboflavin biosynthesis pyrimidine reductase